MVVELNMKPKAKRQTDPAIALARREQILTAAAECFRRKGYHGAGMAEISNTAGMSAGHIYNYWLKHWCAKAHGHRGMCS